MQIEFKLRINTHSLCRDGEPVNMHYIREAATEFIQEAKAYFDGHPFILSCSALNKLSVDEKKKLLKPRPEPRPPKTREDQIRISTPAPKKK